MTDPETIDRQVLSAAELQAEILMRLHDALGLPAGGRDLRVAQPRWQEPDRAGCNWRLEPRDVTGDLKDIMGLPALLRDAIEEVRARYNMDMGGVDDHARAASVTPDIDQRTHGDGGVDSSGDDARTTVRSTSRPDSVG